MTILVLTSIIVLLVVVFGENSLPIELGSEVGVASDSSISQETLQKILAGVESGNKDSIYYFALLKLYGISLSKSPVMAAQNFLRASELGHIEATTAYGVIAMTGMGLPVSPSLAKMYFRKAVRLGDINAHWLLGKMLMEEESTNDYRYHEAFNMFRIAADKHIPQAEHLLAVMYEYGHGIAQDFEKAAEFYRRAAEQNYIDAAFHLGLMYAYGRFFSQDFKRALSLFEKGARDNHAPSTYYMGIFKMYGYGCEPDYHIAFNWFERAAGLGDSRITEMAKKATEELRELIAVAEERNRQTQDLYRTRSEEY